MLTCQKNALLPICVQFPLELEYIYSCALKCFYLITLWLPENLMNRHTNEDIDERTNHRFTVRITCRHHFSWSNRVCVAGYSHTGNTNRGFHLNRKKDWSLEGGSITSRIFCELDVARSTSAVFFKLVLVLWEFNEWWVLKNIFVKKFPYNTFMLRKKKCTICEAHSSMLLQPNNKKETWTA